MESRVSISPIGRRRGDFGSIFFILRWQRTVLANRLRSSAALGKRGVVRIVFEVCFVIAYYLNLLHDLCTGYSPRVKGSSFGATLVAIVLAALIGMVVALPLAGFALRLAYSRWLAGLPVSAGQRLRAASVFGGSLGALTAVPVAVSGWLAAGWLGLPSSSVNGALVTAGYLGGFGLLLMLRVILFWLGQSGRKSQFWSMPGMSVSWFGASGRRNNFPLARFDLNRPRWLGHWAIAWATDPTLMPGLVIVVLVNALGVTASIVQGQDFPALLFAVLAAHLVFLRTLRMHPLASPILRAAPLRFSTAFIGAVRLPLVVSLTAVVPLVITALAVAPGHVDRTLGCLFVVLLLAAQYSVLAAAMPNARGAAILLHFTIIVIAAKESILYQYVVVLVLVGFTLLTWFRAKRRYEG
jgi:hypothetical protein